MSERRLEKEILFSIPFENGDESCYLKGNFNCKGDGSIELLRTKDGKRWEKSIELLPGTYEYFYSINQYMLYNEKRERIKKPIYLDLKVENFFHDPESCHFFSWAGGFCVIRCITPPGVRSVKIIQNGNRKKKSDFRYRSHNYNLFEFISKSHKQYKFNDDSGNEYGPYTPPLSNETRKSSGVIYQIFPDRFNRKGDLEKGLTKWSEPPDRNSFYGGNIDGIIEKIPYLKELGIEHLYLTPFYKSISNHRYDIDDYFSVDYRFGSLDQLMTLSRKLNENGISMILDMVFNHTSTYFPQFLREIKKKPQGQNWYKFIKDTNEGMRIRWTEKDGIKDAFYESFLDYGGMPKLNHRNESVKEFMLKVMEFYAEKLNISFLRYDVAESINLDSIHDIFRKFREKFPEIGHIAELWCISDLFFKDGLYTSSMNYQLRRLIISIMKREIGPKKINSELLNMRFILGDEVYGNMMNIVDSHDTPRIRTTLNSKNLAMASYGILMIMNGMPSIYYGDELSMEGGPDPDCRRTMEWENVGSDFFLRFKKMIKFRKDNPAAFNGIIKFSKGKDGLIRILKYSKEQKLEMILNLSDKKLNKALTGNQVMDSVIMGSEVLDPEEFLIRVL